MRQRRTLEAQVERWTAEAKKLMESGSEAEALELYRRASDELPGAPWLQHRTAEVARRLSQPDVAIAYLRRAAVAFQLADFPKRAVAPLRAAWTLAVERLPNTSRVLIDIAVELMQVQRRLGFAADTTVTFERTNAALRAHGFSELGIQALEGRSLPSARPLSPVPSARPSSLSSRSEVATRSSGSPPEDSPESDRRANAGGHQRR